MRRLGLLLALLLLCAAACRADDAVLIKGGVSVGPYQLGKDFGPSRQALGEPDEIKESDLAHETHLLRYKKAGLAFFVKGKILNGITVFSTDFRTAEGIHVTSTRAEVEKAFGPGVQGSNKDYVTYPELGLAFSYDAQAHVERLYVVDKEARDALKGDRAVVPGQRIGGLKLGMSLSDVVKGWGQPTRTVPFNADPTRQLAQFEKQGVIFIVSAGKVEGITTVSPEYGTADGLRVSSTRSDVYKRYGSHPVHANGIEAYKDKGIGFTFEDDKVTEISILPPK